MRAQNNFKSGRTILLAQTCVLLACLFSAHNANALPPKDLPLSPGLTSEVAAPLSEVLQALQELLHDQTIHGTHIFDKDPTLLGAIQVDSTPLFEPWKGKGQVFYKIRENAIAPRHFLDSADQGTIAVRYIVQSVASDRIRLHIDAVYVESAHRKVHASDGTVESSEYKSFKDHLEAILYNEQEAADAERRRVSSDIAKQSFARQREDETTRLAATLSSIKDLEQRVDTLRHQLERRVKAPGADLKAAPFRSSAKVTSLAAYTEVVIVIVSAHWYGVETPEGQRGWISREQLDPLP